MHVEGPAAIAGQPVHVGWIGDDQEIDPRLFHRVTGFGYARGIFSRVKVQRHTTLHLPFFDVVFDRPAPSGVCRAGGAPGWRWLCPARRCP